MDAFHQELSRHMDECLAQQERSNAQLAQLGEQLSAQEQRTEAIAEQLSSREDYAPGAAAAEPAADCKPRSVRGDKLIVGRMEQVWLPNLGLALAARIDTGAETASLDARSIKMFERNGERWVSFEILDPESGEPIELERKVNRTVLIVQSNSAEPQRRPVIKLTIVIGHIDQTAEFTLSDRSHLDYQVLVGRNILKDVMMVDVSKTNIAPYIVESDKEQNSGKKQ
ncbi:MAG: ATP-dependent zinc protease [Halioglobus sp.]|nr:ATP-dependent zinc protease [Halioglobus sp.]